MKQLMQKTSSTTGAALLLALSLLTVGCQTGGRSASTTPPTRTEQQTSTPAQVRQRLADGNARYVAGTPLARDWAMARAATAGGQFPYAAVLSCLDSRTSAEIIFDQGHGEIFNARVAGNILNDDILGSLEFACQVAGAKLIAVIGHAECGAVKGACSGAKLGHLTGLLERIKPAVTQVSGGQAVDAATQPHIVNAVAEANVRLVLRQIRERSPVLRALLDTGKIALAGGLYDLHSGRVNFLND